MIPIKDLKKKKNGSAFDPTGEGPTAVT